MTTFTSVFPAPSWVPAGLCALALLLAACSGASSQPAPASPSPILIAGPSPGTLVSATRPLPTPTFEPAPSRAPTPLLTPSATPIPIHHPPPYTIAIDAGHGGPSYFGAVHRDASGNVDLIEKDVNLDVALRLDALLRSAGYRTVFTRSGDYTITPFIGGDTATNRRDELQARVDLVNQAQADILVSIHFNGSDDKSTAGTEVYYNPDRPFGSNSYGLADLIDQSLVNAFHGLGYDVRDRGVKNDADVHGDPSNPHSWLLGTNPGFGPSLMPGMIGEALFLSNDAEAALILKDGTPEAIAQGYKAGIDAYFGWLEGQ